MSQPLKAVSTGDVSLKILRDLSEELAPEIELEVDDRQIFMRSAEPPSWLTLLAEADWWIQGLAAYAALYVAEIVKEAAKDTWEGRARAVAAVKATGNRLWHLAEGIARLRVQISPRTRIEVGLPFPDEHFPARLEFNVSTTEEIFVHHLPGLEALISSRAIDGDHLAAGMYLKLLADGSLEVSWQDAHTLEVQEHILRIGDADLLDRSYVEGCSSDEGG